MPGVEISPQTVSSAQASGIDQNTLQQMLQTPDTVHHSTTGSGGLPWPIIALHMKKMPGSDSENSFILLVQSIQEGDTYKTGVAWRIYPELLGVDDATKPMNVFRAFLNKYGMKMETPNGLQTLEMFKAYSPKATMKNGVREFGFELPHVRIGDEDRRVTQTPEMHNCLITRQIGNKMCVPIAYFVNMSNYLHDLKENGVSVQENTAA